MNEESGTVSPERLVPLGEIVGTHGVGGLLRFRPYSDSAAALAAPRLVYLQPRHAAVAPPQAGTAVAPTVGPRQTDTTSSEIDPRRPRRLASARSHGRLVLLRFEDVTTIEDATPFLGSVLSIPERELPATAPGEFYAYQLEGLEVVTCSGDRLGIVDHLIPTGSNEVLVVRDGRREHLIPVIADVVRHVDLAERKIVIDPIDGLLD
jgi:16S rRNA processing protein RimM